MVEVRNEDNYEHLQYYVSAFVNAARSIQQYTYEDARKLGKLKEYDLLVAGNKVFKFFKNIRDDNIHKKPVETNRIGSSSMIGSLFVKTSETTEDQIAE